MTLYVQINLTGLILQEDRVRTLWLITLLILLCFEIPFSNAQTFQESNSFGNATTFENGIPGTWSTTGGGSMATSTLRHKQGNQSLIWNWVTGSKIVVTDQALRDASISKNGGIEFWIYSEQDLEDSIRFDFYNAHDQVQCSFWYRINFTGWRGLWARFFADLGNPNYSVPLERMEIISPGGASSGEIYFDIVAFNTSINYRRSPSWQFAAPYPDPVDEEVKDEWESYLYEQKYPEGTIPIQNEVLPEQIEEFELLTSRFEKWFFGSGDYDNNEYYQDRVDGMNDFIDYGVNLLSQLTVIKHPDGRLTGPGLFATSSKHKPKFGKDIAQKLMLQHALDYRLNGTTSSKDKLLLLFDYMYDQGWAEGSAIESIDHLKLRLVGWVYAVYILRYELQNEPWKDGKSILDREMETMRWFIALNAIFAPDDELMAVNVDDFRSTTLFRLIYILMMDNDDPHKVQYFKHYQAWLDRNLRIYGGWSDGIKPDGMGYHHKGPYMNAYSNHGIHIMCQIAYLLRFSSYDISEESKQNLKYYLMNYRITNQYFDVPRGVSGRISGIDHAKSMVSPYAYLAKCISPDSTDTELAGAMMRLWLPECEALSSYIRKYSSIIHVLSTPGEIEALLQIVNEGYKAEQAPSGFWIKPFASMAVFRNDNWFVSVKGSSSYIFDTENGGNENLYGRYDSHGQMEIIDNKSSCPGFINSGNDYFNGWDWCRVPGTTSVNTSLSELVANDQRNFSPNTFVGGVRHLGKSGLWAMEHDDIHYGTGLRFKKSVFFFGKDLLVCLGSDISSSSPANTESTIFQHVLSSSSGQFQINGDVISSSNYNYLPQGKSTTIIDNFGKGIFIRDDQNLHVSRSFQVSKTMSGDDSGGDVITGWFTHENNSSYEYTVLMNTTESKLSQFAADPDYAVIYRSSDMHMVKYHPGNQTGYAIFNSGSIIERDILRKSSVPIMAMVTDSLNGTVILSICDPDFYRPKFGDIGGPRTFSELRGPYPEEKVIIELNGSLDLDGNYEFVKILDQTSTKTTLEFSCQEARTCEVKLSKNNYTAVPVSRSANEITAYPNPTDGLVRISEQADISVFNSFGALVKSAVSTRQIDLSPFMNGLYILRTKFKGRTSSVKIIKTPDLF